MGFLYLWAVAGAKFSRGQVLFCLDWELSVFHRLLLVKLIIAFSCSGKSVVFSHVQSIFCLSAQSASQFNNWGRSDYDRGKWPSTQSRYLEMLYAWHWYSERQFPQKTRMEMFFWLLSKMPYLPAGSKMASLATMAPVERQWQRCGLQRFPLSASVDRPVHSR